MLLTLKGLMSHRHNAFSVDSHLWFRPRVVAALQPWADISERLRRYLWFRPRVVAALQPWADISERLRRYLWFRPRVVAALQPWADISERLRRYLWFRPTVVAAGLTLARALALEVKLGGIGRLKMVRS